MKFKETKYNLGDKFYKLCENNIREYVVSCVKVCVGHGYQDETHCYELNYLDNCYTRYYTEEELEEMFFTSKKDMMLSMFPDEFKDGLIVK